MIRCSLRRRRATPGRRDLRIPDPRQHLPGPEPGRVREEEEADEVGEADAPDPADPHDPQSRETEDPDRRQVEVEIPAAVVDPGPVEEPQGEAEAEEGPSPDRE